MSELAQAYQRRTGIDIDVAGGGATKGIRSVASGEADLGGSCRHRLSDITGEITALEVNTQLIHVAWDALVPIVNPDNDIYDISLDNLRKVYDGSIDSWQALGGDARRILLCTRKGKSSGVGHMFRLLVFENPAYTFKGESFTFLSSAPLEQEIEAQKYALGVTGISSAKRRKVKVLTINGVSPSKKNIVVGDYPLFRPLYLAINTQASTDVENFVAYILSDEGQQIISQHGTVNLAEGRNLVDLWYAKMKNIGSDVADALNKQGNGQYQGPGKPIALISVRKPVQAKPQPPVFSYRIAPGQGYAHVAKKLIQDSSGIAKRLGLTDRVWTAGNALHRLFNDRTLWPDDIIRIKKATVAYVLQVVRDGVVLEEVTRKGQ